MILKYPVGSNIYLSRIDKIDFLCWTLADTDFLDCTKPLEVLR